MTALIALLLHIFLLSGYLYVGRPWRFFLFFAIVSLYWLAVLSLFVQTLWLEPILSVFAYLVAVGGLSLVLNLFLLLYVATSVDVVRLALQKPLPAKHYSNGSLYLLLILLMFIGLPIIVSAEQLGSIERHFLTQRKSFDKI